MTKNLMTLVMLVGLTSLTACDYFRGDEFKKERSDRAYQSAMDDYRAGRLKEATEGFRKACASNPANPLARFQLACLLQDFEKDYLGAYCAYREFLLQEPNGDKSKIAVTRKAECEKAMSAELAKKHGIGRDAMDEVAQLREKLQKSETRKANLEKQIAETMQRNAELSQDVERLNGLMKSEASAVETGRAVAGAEITEARELLKENDGAPALDRSEAAEAKAVLFGDGADDANTAAGDDASEAKALLAGNDAEGSPLLKQPEGAKERRDAARAAADAAKESAHAAEPARPETYVVQEGDTLYKIARRFYGTTSSAAVRKIQSANKSVISTDFKVKAGQKIVIPAL